MTLVREKLKVCLLQHLHRHGHSLNEVGVVVELSISEKATEIVKGNCVGSF